MLYKNLESNFCYCKGHPCDQMHQQIQANFKAQYQILYLQNLETKVIFTARLSQKEKIQLPKVYAPELELGKDTLALESRPTQKLGLPLP